MSAHTPGPWVVYDDRDTPNRRIEIVAMGKTIAHIYASVLEQDLPNARLIAAAPDLLEALQELLELVGPQLVTNSGTAKARAVIRKATTP